LIFRSDFQKNYRFIIFYYIIDDYKQESNKGDASAMKLLLYKDMLLSNLALLFAWGLLNGYLTLALLYTPQSSAYHVQAAYQGTN